MTDTDVSQQYCVRWNSHLCSLSTAFPQLLDEQRFVDVTLACEGQQIHCHKVVLAACSQYFDSLLAENPCKHPIIILPREIKLWTVQALIEFIYKGQVNVSQAGLPDLVKTGDLLQIRGLCNTDITAGISPPKQAETTNVKANKSQKQTSSEESQSEAVSNITSSTNAADKEAGKDNEIDCTQTEIKQEEIELSDTMDSSDGRTRDDTKPFVQPNNESSEPINESSLNPRSGVVTNSTVGNFGQIRVKAIENLFENYKSIQADNQGRVIINVDEPVVEMNTNNDDDDDEIVINDNVELLPSLRFNKKAMHISIKTRKSSDQRITFGPNMDMYRQSSSCSLKDEDDSAELICMPTMEELAALPEGMDDDDDDVMICNEYLQDDVDATQFDQTPLLSYTEQQQMGYLSGANIYPRTVPKPEYRNVMSNGHSSEETDPNQFQKIFLRNPRGNNPRSYTQEELFMALNSIKQGVSIYRASQQYKVPRKTLRNWMKRWQIKSVFPMPAQLKRAAEKRKEHQDQLYQAHKNSMLNENFNLVGVEYKNINPNTFSQQGTTLSSQTATLIPKTTTLTTQETALDTEEIEKNTNQANVFNITL